ncbi:hypothetical protein EVAR_61346_1 [Eumeta japonica]|uniref:Uncharacterized protein n=1 Tax=Eumeta variegata TaxID=151549 RepID=A0A4C1XZW2_EUMVA|nr:hypothetical protein EVAR_61346_1 [Eumeta japonica]
MKHNKNSVDDLSDSEDGLSESKDDLPDIDKLAKRNTQPVKYHTLTEYERIVKSSAVASSTVSESAGGPLLALLLPSTLSLSIRYHMPSQEANTGDSFGVYRWLPPTLSADGSVVKSIPIAPEGTEFDPVYGQTDSLICFFNRIKTIRPVCCRSWILTTVVLSPQPAGQRGIASVA